MPNPTYSNENQSSKNFQEKTGRTDQGRNEPGRNEQQRNEQGRGEQSSSRDTGSARNMSAERSTTRERNGGADRNGTKEMLVERLNEFSDKIQKFLPQGGALGTTSETISAKIDDLCTYIENNNVKDMVYGVGAVVKKRPLPFLLGLAGIGIGLVLSATSSEGDAAKSRNSKSGAKDLH